jgi:hypothetical protein
MATDTDAIIEDAVFSMWSATAGTKIWWGYAGECQQ